MHQQSELLTHIQNTNSQYNLPAFPKRIGRSENREGIARAIRREKIFRGQRTRVGCIAEQHAPGAARHRRMTEPPCDEALIEAAPFCSSAATVASASYV